MVFAFVGPFVEGVAGVFDFRVLIFDGDALRVMAGGDGGEPVIARIGAEHAKFDFAVAHDVGVRREALRVTVEEIRDHALAILLHEIHDAELDAETVANGAGIVDVLLPRTVADDFVLVDPILHVGSDDGHALALEDEGGDGAVDAAGHGDENFSGADTGGDEDEG